MKRLLTLLIYLILIVALSGLAQAQDNQITLVFNADPQTLDPHARTARAYPAAGFLIYDTLVYQDDTGAILPSLAEEYTISEDGLTLTFTLREGIRFSDGTELDVDDVIFTYERLQEIGQFSQIYENMRTVERFERVDDRTVRFHLSEPSADLLSRLALPYAGILSPEAVEAAGDDYGFNPVGTGPYVASNWTPQVGMTLTRNPYYEGHRPWTQGGIPAIETIEVRFLRDQSTIANGLRSGDVDIAQLDNTQTVSSFENDPNFITMTNVNRGVYNLTFNTRREPFNDVRVRQALAMATDKELINLFVNDGRAFVAHTPLTPTLLGYSEELAAEAPTFDPGAAQALLTEAGFGPGNPLEIDILTGTLPTSLFIATVMEQLWSPLGIQVNIRQIDGFVSRDILLEGDYDVAVRFYASNDPDVLRQFFASDGLQNYTGWNNPEFDEIVAQAHQVYDPVERAALYEDAQRLLMEEVPMLPLFAPNVWRVMSSNVQGVSYLVDVNYLVMEDATLSD